jgi:hypothetical protein
MKKFLFILLLTLLSATLSIAGEKKGRSYLKYPPDDKILKPLSFWNPLLNIEDGKLKSKSFFKYPDSKALPQGSMWNPLITIEEKK